MMTIYQRGKDYALMPNVTGMIVDEIEPAIYSLCMDDKRNFILVRELDLFKAPKKIFGDQISAVARRVGIKYQRSNKIVTVATSGGKGMGKTAQMEYICNQFITKHKKPVIRVDCFIPGELLRELIRQVGECCFWIDEYDKKYVNHELADDNDKSDSIQGESLLALLSDCSITKCLFLLALNNADRVNEHMFNRPGRVDFWITHESLATDVVEDIINYKNPEAPWMQQMYMHYCKYCNKLTIDIALEVADMIASAASIEDALEWLKISNIPSPTVFSMEIMHTRNGTVSKVGNIEVKDRFYWNNDWQLTLNVINPDTGASIAELKINELLKDAEFVSEEYGEIIVSWKTLDFPNLSAEDIFKKPSIMIAARAEKMIQDAPKNGPRPPTVMTQKLDIGDYFRQHISEMHNEERYIGEAQVAAD